MAVKILIKRRVPRESQEYLRNYLTKLRALATVQPGYISGETLRNLEDPEEYLVISTWQSVDNWKSWLENEERKEIMSKVEPLLKGTTEHSIYLQG